MEIMVAMRFLLLFILLVGAAYTDVAHRKIYNWLTIPAMLSGVFLAAMAAVLASNWQPMLPCLIGAGAGSIFYAFFLLGWIGGGDVKLMVAIGSLQGPPLEMTFIFNAIFLTSLVSACMALVLLIWEGRLLAGFINCFKLMANPRRKDVATEQHGTIPYGLAMVMGTIWSLVISFREGLA